MQLRTDEMIMKVEKVEIVFLLAAAKQQQQQHLTTIGDNISSSQRRRGSGCKNESSRKKISQFGFVCRRVKSRRRRRRRRRNSFICPESPRWGDNWTTARPPARSPDQLLIQLRIDWEALVVWLCLHYSLADGFILVFHLSSSSSTRFYDIGACVNWQMYTHTYL